MSLNLKVGSIYSYHGRKGVLIGYNFNTLYEKHSSYKKIAISYVLGLDEFKAYLLWNNAVLFDLEDKRFFYFSTDILYQEPLYIEDMPDFDTFFVKLLMIYSEYFSIMSMTLYGQEEAVEELNSERMRVMIADIVSHYGTIQSVADKSVQDARNHTIHVFGCQIKFVDFIYIELETEGEKLTLDFSEKNFRRLMALAMAGNQFIGYYMKEVLNDSKGGA